MPWYGWWPRGRRRGRGRGRGWCYWLWINGGNTGPIYPMWGYWGRGFGRRYWRGYCWWIYSQSNVWGMAQANNVISNETNTNAGRENILSRARNVLDNSSLIRSLGSTILHIVYNGITVGYLWSDVSKKDLEFGEPTFNGYYWYVPLQHKNKVVGYLYL